MVSLPPNHEEMLDLGRIVDNLSDVELPESIVPINMQSYNGSNHYLLMAINGEGLEVDPNVYYVVVDVPLFVVGQNEMRSGELEQIMSLSPHYGSLAKWEGPSTVIGGGNADEMSLFNVVSGPLKKVMESIPENPPIKELEVLFAEAIAAKEEADQEWNYRDLRDAFQNVRAKEIKRVLNKAENFTRSTLLYKPLAVNEDYLEIPKITHWDNLFANLLWTPQVPVNYSLVEQTVFDNETVPMFDSNGHMVITTTVSDETGRYSYVNLSGNGGNDLTWNGPEEGITLFDSEEDLLSELLRKSAPMLVTFGSDAKTLRRAGTDDWRFDFNENGSSEYVPGRLVANLSNIMHQLGPKLFPKSQISVLHHLKEEEVPNRDNLLYTKIRSLHDRGNPIALQYAEQRSFQDVDELLEVESYVGGMIGAFAEFTSNDISSFGIQRLGQLSQHVTRKTRILNSMSYGVPIGEYFTLFTSDKEKKWKPVDSKPIVGKFRISYKDATPHYNYLFLQGLPESKQVQELLASENPVIQFMAHRFVRKMAPAVDTMTYFLSQIDDVDAYDPKVQIPITRFVIDERTQKYKPVDGSVDMSIQKFEQEFGNTFGLMPEDAEVMMGNDLTTLLASNSEAIYEDDNFRIDDAASEVPTGYNPYMEGEGIIIKNGTKGKPIYFIRDGNGNWNEMGSKKMTGKATSQGAKDILDKMLDYSFCNLIGEDMSHKGDRQKGDGLLYVVAREMINLRYGDLKLSNLYYKSKGRDVIPVKFLVRQEVQRKGKAVKVDKEVTYGVPTDIIFDAMSEETLISLDADYTVTEEQIDSAYVLDEFRRLNKGLDVLEYAGIDRYAPMGQAKIYPIFDLFEYNEETLKDLGCWTSHAENPRQIIEYHRIWSAMEEGTNWEKLKEIEGESAQNE